MPPSFLQSAEWERFEQSLGRATWRPAGGTLVVRRDLPLGFNYLYCPRSESRIMNQESGAVFFTSIKKIAEQERSIFLKIDPSGDIFIPPFLKTPASLDAGIPRHRENPFRGVLNPAERAGFIPASSVRHPTSSIQPRQTIVLDLADRTEDELLAAMHEKTRYNIRLAERKGVTVRRGGPETQEKDFEIFWKLLRETARRDGFRTHPREYYKKLLAIRLDHFSNELFFAEYEGEVLAAAMLNFYRGSTSIDAIGSAGGTATYLHGASSRRHRETMAPHLLQWRMIQEARQRGCAQYDFWGVDERRWPGVTRFKRGFGGREIVYPQSVDIAYRPVVYAAYWIAKKIKL